MNVINTELLQLKHDLSLAAQKPQQEGLKADFKNTVDYLRKNNIRRLSIKRKAPSQKTQATYELLFTETFFRYTERRPDKWIEIESFFNDGLLRLNQQPMPDEMLPKLQKRMDMIMDEIEKELNDVEIEKRDDPA